MRNYAPLLQDSLPIRTTSVSDDPNGVPGGDRRGAGFPCWKLPTGWRQAQASCISFGRSAYRAASRWRPSWHEHSAASRTARNGRLGLGFRHNHCTVAASLWVCSRAGARTLDYAAAASAHQQPPHSAPQTPQGQRPDRAVDSLRPLPLAQTPPLHRVQSVAHATHSAPGPSSHAGCFRSVRARASPIP